MRLNFKWVYLIIFLFFILPVLPSIVLSSENQKGIFGTFKKNPFLLVGTIYCIPEGTNKLPDFSKLKPIGKIYTETLNITPRNFDEGFPGVTDRFEWFAINYEGKFYISKDGTYTFSLLSDDGAKLIIDGKVVIDNDGIHPPVEKTGSIYLKEGIHTIEIPYFQGPRWQVALVLYLVKNGKKEIFDMKDFALVRMEETEEFTSLILSTGILFDFDSYQLKPEAKVILNAIIEFLKDYSYTKIIVEGYTDDIGSESYNLKLSQKRAEAVTNYLINNGIAREKIETIGYGESKPRYPNTTEENRRKNRRVEIKVIKISK